MQDDLQILHDEMLKFAQRRLKRYEGFPAFMFCAQIENGAILNQTRINVNDKMETGESKNQLSAAMRAIVQNPEIDAVGLVSETWISHYGAEVPPDAPSPAGDPNHSEGVLILVMCKTGQKTWLYHTDPATRELTLQDAAIESGRFAGDQDATRH